MFKNTLDLLERVSKGIELRIPVTILATDEHGFFDRRCPTTTCGEAFKVHTDDWKNLVPDERAFCPLCRHEGPPDDWNTPAQMETIKQHGLSFISGELNAALSADTSAFNEGQPRGGLVELSLSFRRDAPPVVVPASASEVMETRSACEACGCRYASIGAAFFCPACGHNSARTTFTQVVTTVRNLVVQLPVLVATVAGASTKDAARDFERGALEHSLQRLVSAFQRFAEAAFAEIPAAAALNPRRNAFQSLAEGSDLWERAVGRRYEAMLSATDLADLRRLFQQRHLLAHQEGIVDQDYINRSADQTYAVGQRLVVRAEHVVTLAELVEHLATELGRHAWPT